MHRVLHRKPHSRSRATCIKHSQQTVSLDTMFLINKFSLSRSFQNSMTFLKLYHSFAILKTLNEYINITFIQLFKLKSKLCFLNKMNMSTKMTFDSRQFTCYKNYKIWTNFSVWTRWKTNSLDCAFAWKSVGTTYGTPCSIGWARMKSVRPFVCLGRCAAKVHWQF